MRIPDVEDRRFGSDFDIVTVSNNHCPAPTRPVNAYEFTGTVLLSRHPALWWCIVADRRIPPGCGIDVWLIVTA